MSAATIVALLVVALLVVALLALFGWRASSGRSGLPKVDVTPDRPQAFGYKMGWLAVRSEDVDAVCASLQRADDRFAGRKFRACNWSSGMGRITANFRNPEVFVTPALAGWVLLVNWHPRSESDALLEEVRGVLESLSREHGRAALFDNHRVVSLACWALADDGVLRRYFAEADATTYVDFGQRLPEEPADMLTSEQLHALPDDERDDDDLYDRLPDESTVVDLARQLTIDPTTIDALACTELGRIARPGRG